MVAAWLPRCLCRCLDVAPLYEEMILWVCSCFWVCHLLEDLLRKCLTLMSFSFQLCSFLCVRTNVSHCCGYVTECTVPSGTHVVDKSSKTRTLFSWLFFCLSHCSSRFSQIYHTVAIATTLKYSTDSYLTDPLPSGRRLRSVRCADSQTLGLSAHLTNLSPGLSTPPHSHRVLCFQALCSPVCGVDSPLKPHVGPCCLNFQPQQLLLLDRDSRRAGEWTQQLALLLHNRTHTWLLYLSEDIMLSPAAYLNPNHNLTVTLLLKPRFQPQTCFQKLFDGRLVPTSILTVEFLVLTRMYKCAHRHTEGLLHSSVLIHY